MQREVHSSSDDGADESANGEMQRRVVAEADAGPSDHGYDHAGGQQGRAERDRENGGGACGDAGVKLDFPSSR